MKSTEAQLQSESIRWFRYQYPKYSMLLFAIPNGGSRNKLEAVNLKRQGVMAGVADCFLAIPYKENNVGYWIHGMFIEFKAPNKPPRQTPEQKNFQIEVEQQGYMYALVNSFDRFKEIIEKYFK